MQDITLSDAIPFVRINRIPEKFSKGAIQYVVTNIFGESIVLRDTECADYLSNTLTDVDLKKDLEDRLFYKSPDYEDRAHIEYQKRFGVNFIGPTLHIIVLTKGCNHQCKYCHAAADYRFEDDSLKMESTTSEKVVDIIFQSPGQLLTIEFQWGEPLSNIDVIEHIVARALELNTVHKKNIQFALVTNMTLVDEAMADRLFKIPNLTISTSLDGPKKVHDFNRLLLAKGKTLSSYDAMTDRIRYLRTQEEKHGKKLLMGAMGVITRKTLPAARELVDTFQELGFDSIFLKKVNNIGFAQNTKSVLGYSKEELQKFYLEYFDVLIDKFRGGKFIADGFLAICITKIISPEMMNFMDLRSPCGAGIGQISYDFTGKIYTCDEGRMIDGDTFQIGDVSHTLKELIQNEIIATMMDASTVESLPCDSCAYAPFCGVCPIESYQARGNIYTNQVFDGHCSFFMFLFDWIFAHLTDKESIEYAFIMKHVNSAEITDIDNDGIVWHTS